MQVTQMKNLGLTTILAALVVGCSGGDASPDPAAPAAPLSTPRTDARTLPIPGSPGSAPTGQAASGPLAWSIPATWIEEQPASNMRWAQYRVPGDDGDGECIVFYFGPGQGGDPSSNAQRWAGQFTQPDGRSSTDLMVFERLEGTPLPAYIVEVTGTYDGGMSGPMDVTGYMLLGGIVEGPDAPWFFKLIGRKPPFAHSTPTS